MMSCDNGKESADVSALIQALKDQCGYRESVGNDRLYKRNQISGICALARATNSIDIMLQYVKDHPDVHISNIVEFAVTIRDANAAQDEEKIRKIMGLQ